MRDTYLQVLGITRDKLEDQLELTDDSYEREALAGQIDGLTIAINLYQAYGLD